MGAIKTLLEGDFPGLTDGLGDVSATEVELLEAAAPLLLALYGQLPGTSVESALYKLFTKKKKSPKVMSLLATTPNILQHVLRAHLQVMLWKAADHQAPPDESVDITAFGWDIQDGIPVPVTSKSDPAPPELIDVINCQCKVEGKKCITTACGCHKEHLSCMSYCYCSGEDGCCNPYTNGRDGDGGQAAEEDDTDMEDTVEDVEEDFGDDRDVECRSDQAGDISDLDCDW